MDDQGLAIVNRRVEQRSQLLDFLVPRLAGQDIETILEMIDVHSEQAYSNGMTDAVLLCDGLLSRGHLNKEQTRTISIVREAIELLRKKNRVEGVT